MNIKVYNDGYFSLFGNDDERITRSPLGIHIYEHCAYLPQSCVFDGKKAVVTYPHGSCTITFENKTNYTKLTLSEVSSGTTGFIFGPYKTTASYFGEILGAGWYDDNSVVCIQSLMPKVEEGIIPRIENNCTDIDFTNFVKAASRADDFVYLHCSVKDRTNDEIDNNGFCVQALNGDDAVVEGASVALLYADNADLLLDYIGELEINEDLPHPTYLGNYAKKDKRVSSFYFVIDGLEGCYETGHGNYGCAKYVKDTLAAAGNELICESSIMTHYLWHAFSYCNWGEPHYDSSRRGGMHAYRARNQAFYKRNLIPAMLGWYTLFIASDDGKWEATPPENMEHILSRSVAFDAGEALRFNTDTIRKHGLMGEYLDMISVWNRFRHEADIPDELRTRMMDEESDWHLEETEDGWKLTQLIIRDQDLSYCDREVATEGGSVGTGSITENNRIHHSTVMVFDGSYPLDADGIYPHLPSVDAEPIRFRIKVGKPGLGYMENLNIYDTLNFKFKANGGEYLVYEGGTTLYRYDLNYNLLETIEGEGTPFVMPKGEPFLWGELKYTTDNNPNASYLFKEFRQKQIYNIKKKIK